MKNTFTFNVFNFYESTFNLFSQDLPGIPQSHLLRFPCFFNHSNECNNLHQYRTEYYLALLMQIRAVIAICFDLTGRQPFKINFYYVLPMLLLVSLRKRTTERRGQQNA